MFKASFLTAILMCVFFSVMAQSEDFSYVYIQGDKKTPIYVKLEGNMMPRYGKNYCIIPQLAPGPIHVSVLFQQNAFPEQKFTIMVPEDGSRHFLLNQKNGAFSLYDLDERFFLKAGNTIEEDNPNGAHTALAEVPVNNQQTTAAPATPAVAQKTATASPEKKNPEPKKNQQPEFLDNVTLNRPHTAASEPTGTEETSTATNAQQAVVLRNSDCPEPMSEGDFKKLYRNMLDRSSDEDRVAFLLDKTDECLATWQLRALASVLQMDAGRFMVVKRFYSRITDQQNFPLLDDLFREPAWQEAFIKLIEP